MDDEYYQYRLTDYKYRSGYIAWIYTRDHSAISWANMRGIRGVDWEYFYVDELHAVFGFNDKVMFAEFIILWQ